MFEITHLVKYVRGALLLGASCLSLCVGAGAQEASAGFNGVVKDRQHSVIPQAHVTLRHVGTNQVKTADTDASGSFSFIGLPGGGIEVIVESSGFATLVVSGLSLSENSTTLAEFSLDVETRLGEKVIVTDPASSTSVRVSSDSSRFESLPFTNRSAFTLLNLAAGVTTQARDEKSLIRGEFGNQASADGAPSTGLSNATPVTPGVGRDAVSEYQVVEMFTAEEDYSDTNYRTVLKAGSNDLHGSLSFDFRHDALQAKGPFGGASDPSFDREWLSGTLGGPIKKNRAYYFFSLDHRHDDAATTAGRRDAATRRIVQTFAQTPTDDTRLLAKVNANVVNDSVSGAYAFGRRRGTTTGTPEGGRLQDPNNFQTESADSHLLMANWTHVFNPNLVNDLSFKFSAAGLKSAPVSSAPQIAFPSINVGSNFRSMLDEGQRVLQLTNMTQWLWHNQTFKFGGDFKRTSLETRRLNLFGAGVIFVPCDFPGEPGCPSAASDAEIPVLSAYINRRRLGGSPAGFAAGPPLPDISNNRVALFAQDEIRFTDLTLSLGLRWEYDTDINGLNQANQARPGRRRAKKSNLGPRFGIAWRLGKGVIRGGHGLYFTEVGLGTRQLELLADGARQPLIRSFGGTLADPFGHVLSGAPPDIFVTSNSFRAPYVQRFALEGQYELHRDLTVSAAYDGRRGRHFGRRVELNLQPDGSRVNAAFGSVLETQSIGETGYDALALNLTKRYARGYALLGTYTLSRATNEENAPTSLLPRVSDPSDPAADRGPSPYDARHRLAISGFVELPLGFTFSGTLNASSNYPFEIIQNHDFSGGRGTNFYRLPVLGRNAGGRELRTGADVNRAIDLFNADAALVGAHGGAIAHVNPNLDLTRRYFSLDLGLFKTFSFGEDKGVRLRLGVDFFNVTNHTNIYGTSPMNISGLQNNVESPNFGEPLGVLPGGVFGAGAPRAAQLSARFSF
jgi:hypothetical protein